MVKGKRMSSKRWTLFALVLIAAIVLTTASPRVFADDAHNLILFIPEALPAAGVDQTNAPALARLRHEGVHFIESHSGFPRIAAADSSMSVFELDARSLASAATGRYLAAFINDVRTSEPEPPPGLQILRDSTLPYFKRLGRPFFVVYRLRELRDTPLTAAYKLNPWAADVALEAIDSTLKSLDLYATTNIVVAAEHGLSRVLKVSATSRARVRLPREKTLGTLPPGFLAIDLIAAFKKEDSALELFDRDSGNAFVDWSSGGFPRLGNAVIAADFDPSKPYVTVEAHGVYDTIYISDAMPKQERKAAARLIVETIFDQDYTGGVFVNEQRVGKLPGTLPLSHILEPDEDLPLPDIVVAFSSVSGRCAQPIACTTVIADSPLAEGEGIPNSFSRAGTWTFMAARGPDFQRGMIDRMPASNADITKTVAELLGLGMRAPNARVLVESLADVEVARVPGAQSRLLSSKPTTEGHVTQLRLQSLGTNTYFDAAGSARDERVAEAGERRWHWHFPRPKRVTIAISGDDD
jgi:hypothetical protein